MCGLPWLKWVWVVNTRSEPQTNRLRNEEPPTSAAGRRTTSPLAAELVDLGSTETVRSVRRPWIFGTGVSADGSVLRRVLLRAPVPTMADGT